MLARREARRVERGQRLKSVSSSLSMQVALLCCDCTLRHPWGPAPWHKAGPLQLLLRDVQVTGNGRLLRRIDQDTCLRWFVAAFGTARASEGEPVLKPWCSSLTEVACRSAWAARRQNARKVPGKVKGATHELLAVWPSWRRAQAQSTWWQTDDTRDQAALVLPSLRRHGAHGVAASVSASFDSRARTDPIRPRDRCSAGATHAQVCGRACGLD